MLSMGSSNFRSVTLVLLFIHVAGGREVPVDNFLHNISVSSRNELKIFNRDHNNTVSIDLEDSKDKFLAANPTINHFAVISSKGEYKEVFGKLNIYHPPVNRYQVSATAVWFTIGTGGPRETYNAIQVGFHVYPQLYGDNELHFFVAWTSDGYKYTGCYNLQCGGFVVSSAADLKPGSVIRQSSQYNGKQYYFTFKITRDTTGKWYIYHGDGYNKPIGYYPTALFNNLQDHATRVDVGGAVQFYKGDCTPPMGSGHFASEGKGKAADAYVYYKDKKGRNTDLPGSIVTDKPNFYTVVRTDGGFFFGGPGGCAD